MTEILTPEELRKELYSLLPHLNTKELNILVTNFVSVAGGKYVVGKNWLKEKRNEEITTLRVKEGLSPSQIARRVNLSPRSVRRILRNHK